MRTRSPWFVAGTIEQGSSADDAWEIDVTDVGLTNPTAISTVGIYNVTDPDNVSADLSGTLLAGSPDITTTTWTTPLVRNLQAENKYRLHALITDEGKKIELVVFFWCPY